MNFGHILFSFRGRINRAKWWLAVLINIILAVVVAIISAFLPEGAAAGILGFIVYIVTLWIYLAASAKRLHDINKSGAWLVLFIGGPILLLIIGIAIAGMSVGTALLTGQGSDLSPEAIGGIVAQLGGIGLIFGVLWLVLAIWAFIWLGCLRGTVGPNQYGPDPLEGRV